MRALRCRAAAAGAATTAAVLLAGCLPAPAEDPAAQPRQTRPTSVDTAPADAATPSGASVTGSPRSPTSGPGAVVVDVNVANGAVAPNGRRFDVAKGRPVLVNVASDIDDEIHVHTASEGLVIPVQAGGRASRSFLAADSGRFEIESHELGKIIAVLVVR